ncbi:hypothetical protein LACPH_001054 [Lacticaseibacillus parahuelsenbergensis]|uniref:Uncharacterized protein n=1 Tax=Lacticaseibacillus parahuelsenbergensis TaxID=3068305 RepID=A0ABY9L6B0_9LACO|nr:MULTISPECIES: hypothetical protein [Lacticaseibacillus]MDE3282131.1 hypothetical protein [Lacticaseibacillus casei]WLV79023.1 hypothetical protein LACPH_001054 [Lacticaseibacillus sp. NCIMB 15471]
MDQLKEFATQVVQALKEKGETNETKKLHAMALLLEKEKVLGLEPSEQDINKARRECV